MWEKKVWIITSTCDDVDRTVLGVWADKHLAEDHLELLSLETGCPHMELTQAVAARTMSPSWVQTLEKLRLAAYMSLEDDDV
jgi:hypothetical protein